MKRRPYWVLKTRYGKYLTDPMSPSVFQPILFSTRGSAESYARKDAHIPAEWYVRPVRVFLTLVEEA